MIFIGICDDDKKIINLLKDHVDSVTKDLKERVIITEYIDSRNLVYDLDEGKYFDLILCDIEMPNYDGMRVAEIVKASNPDTILIFITNHLKYAVDAYELSIFRYIPKKLLEEKLDSALKDAVKIISSRSQRFYCIITANRIEKIPYEKIVHIWKEGKNAYILTNNGDVTFVRKSLFELMHELDSDCFIFINRGNIINIKYVEKIKGSIVYIKDTIRLTVSQTQIEELKRKLIEYWGGLI